MFPRVLEFSRFCLSCGHGRVRWGCGSGVRAFYRNVTFNTSSAVRNSDQVVIELSRGSISISN